MDADSLFLKTKNTLGDYLEYRNRADSKSSSTASDLCSRIDMINVFEVSKCDHASEQKVNNDKLAETAISAVSSLLVKKKVKRSASSSGHSSSSDTTTETVHEPPSITFSADIVYIENCIVIAIITTIFITSFFAVYYFCNKDLVNSILSKVKHFIMKVFRRDNKSGGQHSKLTLA
jgi:hypothetical protein